MFQIERTACLWLRYFFFSLVVLGEVIFFMCITEQGYCQKCWFQWDWSWGHWEVAGFSPHGAISLQTKRLWVTSWCVQAGPLTKPSDDEWCPRGVMRRIGARLLNLSAQCLTVLWLCKIRRWQIRQYGTKIAVLALPELQFIWNNFSHCQEGCGWTPHNLYPVLVPDTVTSWSRNTTLTVS